jgi:hypothetical protein
MQVLEETGCDVSTLLKLEDYIEVSIGQKRVRLYIITGVKRDTVFAPQTKKEISVCRILKILLYHFSISQNAEGFSILLLVHLALSMCCFVHKKLSCGIKKKNRKK